MKNDEIRIGALYPLSGANKYIGQSIYKALEFYANLVNNQDKIPVPPNLVLPSLNGCKIKLIWADTEGDPIIAQAEAKKLIEAEGVTSLIGSYQSSVSAVVALQTETYKIPYLSPDTDAKMLTQRGFKWFFRTGPDDVVYTKCFFDMMNANGFGHSTVASFTENTLLGQDEAQAVINLSRWYRQHVSEVELYDINFPITPQKLLNLKYSNSDFIFTAQFDEDAVQTIKILKELNYYPMGIFDQDGTYNFANVLSALGKAADYVVSASPWAIGLTKIIPLAKEANSMFRTIYGEDFNSVNSASFTGLYVLIDAINRAGSKNPAAIRKALVETSIAGDRLIFPWKGIRFNCDGENIFAKSLLVQIFNEMPKIVWPKNLAETNIILPTPPWCRR